MESTWDLYKVEAKSKLKWQEDLLTNAGKNLRKILEGLPHSGRSALAVILTQTDLSLKIATEVMEELAGKAYEKAESK